MRLSELRTGEKGVIVKVMGRGAFRKRIIEMGFIKGKEVDVIQNAPLRDPIHYRVMGYDISLRRNDAALIEVVSEAEFAAAQAESKEQSRTADSYIITDNDDIQTMAFHKGHTINVALVGNPNCGMTSLFNYVCGRTNVSETTVVLPSMPKRGHFTTKGTPSTLSICREPIPSRLTRPKNCMSGTI